MKDWRERVAVDANICHGQPCIRGTRIQAWLILGLLANGDTVEEILEAYSSLSHEDILAALSYATEMTRKAGREPGLSGEGYVGKGCV
jgi:uncharacterized protein (DUF433 family)